MGAVGDVSEGRPDVAWAWRRLEETYGGLPAAALTQELGCTPRHLAGRFREDVGLSPKRLARVLRFRRALDLLQGEDPGRLGEVAAACGYFDRRTSTATSTPSRA